MKNLDELFFFVIDVESLGLYGDAFAVSYGVLSPSGAIQYGDTICIDRNDPSLIGSDEDKQWIRENIPFIEINCPSLHQMRERFWKAWIDAKNKYPGIVMAAECLYPVEGNFLTGVVKQNEEDVRKWNAPYPFLEISSIMMAAGMDPMANYDRKPSEEPKHHPFADVTQSARLLFEAINNLDETKWYK